MNTDNPPHLPQHPRSGDGLTSKQAKAARAPYIEAAANRLEGLLRDADPRSAGARYIEAASDPNYRAAFAKILARPQDAHLRMSPAELEAHHRVDEAKRALNVSTGSERGRP